MVRREEFWLCTLLLLVGCDSSPGASNATDSKSFAGGLDSGFRKGWRKEFVPACAASATKAAPSAPVNFTTLCGCVADKLLASKTSSELLSLSDDDAKPLFEQCVAEGKTR
jgi:hypothetical protein